MPGGGSTNEPERGYGCYKGTMDDTVDVYYTGKNIIKTILLMNGCREMSPKARGLSADMSAKSKGIRISILMPLLFALYVKA